MRKEAFCKKCRRAGTKLFLKGERCQTKCALTRRNYAPGSHGNTRQKISGYGLQLREKQKAKSIYGIGERQFKNYFKEAASQSGDTREVLMQNLELRFDNVIYRSGLAVSRDQAREFASHGHFLINDKKNNIPSLRLKEGDKISLSEKSSKKEPFATLLKGVSKAQIPSWLKLDAKKGMGEIARIPKREEIDTDIDEQLIIEYYSK